MRNALALFVCALVVLGPERIRAQTTQSTDDFRVTPDEILLNALKHREDRTEGVDQFMVVDRFMLRMALAGLPQDPVATGLLREKVWCRDERGELKYIWREVPAEEVQVRMSQGELPSSGILRTAADSVVRAGRMFNENLEREGVPVGLIASLNPEPWGGQDGFNILNPGHQFAGYAIFLNTAADAVDAARSAGSPAQQACEAAARRDVTVADDAELVGQESMHGRTAHVIRVDGLNRTQPAGDGVEFTLQTASMWVDAEHYVPLRTRFEGVATQSVALWRAPDRADDVDPVGRRHRTGAPGLGERMPVGDRFEPFLPVTDAPSLTHARGESRRFTISRPVTIEKEELDYRTVPGSDMYESYRQVLRIQGFTELGPEAEEAQREMARLEQELAAMPPDQQAMVERMMGDKLETMRKMAAGEGIEVEVVVDTIIVNPGVPRIEGGPGPLEAVAFETAPVLPLHLAGDWVGVLRYAPPGDDGDDYFIDVKRLTSSSPEAWETLVAGMGPYGGPVVAVYIDDLNGLGVPLDQLELEVYQASPRRATARFRPEIDPARAESLADCGTVSSTAACSNTEPPG